MFIVNKYFQNTILKYGTIAFPAINLFTSWKSRTYYMHKINMDAESDCAKQTGLNFWNGALTLVAPFQIGAFEF